MYLAHPLPYGLDAKPRPGPGLDREKLDSQDDSQILKRRRPMANVSGVLRASFDLVWAFAAIGGHQKRGLQNRVGSSVEVRTGSLVSADVHPLER